MGSSILRLAYYVSQSESTPARCSGKKADVQQQRNTPRREPILGRPHRVIGGGKSGVAARIPLRRR